jgi:hypothetical protein
VAPSLLSRSGKRNVTATRNAIGVASPAIPRNFRISAPSMRPEAPRDRAAPSTRLGMAGPTRRGMTVIIEQREHLQQPLRPRQRPLSRVSAVQGPYRLVKGSDLRRLKRGGDQR